MLLLQYYRLAVLLLQYYRLVVLLLQYYRLVVAVVAVLQATGGAHCCYSITGYRCRCVHY